MAQDPLVSGCQGKSSVDPLICVDPAQRKHTVLRRSELYARHVTISPPIGRGSDEAHVKADSWHSVLGDHARPDNRCSCLTCGDLLGHRSCSFRDFEFFPLVHDVDGDVKSQGIRDLCSRYTGFSPVCSIPRNQTSGARTQRRGRMSNQRASS